MNATELDTFVFKFKQLWKSGLEVHLDLECHGGQAWVGIRVQLGCVPGPKNHPHIQPQQRRTRDGPSRQRRRARRAAARQEIAEEAVDEKKSPEKKDAAEVVFVDDAEIAKHNITDEFCPNAEYTAVEELSDENSVTFRFVTNDPALIVCREAFENNLKKNFVNT